MKDLNAGNVESTENKIIEQIEDRILRQFNWALDGDCLREEDYIMLMESAKKLLYICRWKRDNLGCSDFTEKEKCILSKTRDAIERAFNPARIDLDPMEDVNYSTFLDSIPFILRIIHNY